MKYILFSVLLFSACVTERKRAKICETCPEKEIKEVETTETTRDSISLDTISEPADSAFYWLYLQCKDGSKPEIKEEAKKDGKRTKTSKTYNEKTGKLVFKCNSDSLQKEIEIKNKIIERLKRESLTKTHKPSTKGMVVWYYALIISILTFIIGFVYGKYKPERI